MADDKSNIDKNKEVTTGLGSITEQLKTNNRSQAGRDSMRTKNERDLLASQEDTNVRIDDLKKETLANRAAIVNSEDATTQTADAVEDATKGNEQTKRQESKENIKEGNQEKKLFTGLGKVFKDSFTGLSKSVTSAITSPFSSLGVDPKQVGKSLLSIGLIVGLIAFFKSPLFEKLKEFVAKAKPALMAVVNAVKAFVGAFAENIGPIVNSIVGVFTEAFNGIKDIVQGLFSGDASQFMTGIKSILFDLPIKLVSIIGDAFFSLVESVLAVFGIESEMVTNIKLAFRTLPEAIEKAIQGVMDFFTVTIPEFFNETLPEKYEAFKESVKTGVSNLLSAIVDPIIALKDNIMESVDMGVAKIKAGIMNVVITVKNAFNGFVDGLKNMANGVIGLLNKVPGVNIDKFTLSTDKPEALVDADDIVVAQRAEDLRNQKMKLANEQEIADTLEMSMPKQIPEKVIEDVRQGTTGSIPDSKETFSRVTSKAFIQGEGAEEMIKLMNEPINAEKLAAMKNLEKENAELKTAAASNNTVIQNNVDNSVKSAVSQGSSNRILPITGPMHPLYGQTAN